MGNIFVEIYTCLFICIQEVQIWICSNLCEISHMLYYKCHMDDAFETWTDMQWLSINFWSL